MASDAAEDAEALTCAIVVITHYMPVHAHATLPREPELALCSTVSFVAMIACFGASELLAVDLGSHYKQADESSSACASEDRLCTSTC